MINQNYNLKQKLLLQTIDKNNLDYSNKNEKITKLLYLKDEIDNKNKDVIRFIEEIKTLALDIKYTSKENALEDLKKKDPELVKILEKQNPLPNSFNIIIKTWFNSQFETILNKYVYLFN